MLVLKPPTPLPSPHLPSPYAASLFLAGSIELGKADNWQVRAEAAFAEYPDDFVIFNPRRDNWDWTTEQSVDSPVFNEQVTWELDALTLAHHILVYFDPNTKSPISLMELGLFHKKKPFVVCPPGFWRRGNVEIVCRRYVIPFYSDIDSAITDMKKHSIFLKLV